MREVLLLWLFAAVGIGAVIAVVVLALGVVFGAVWLLWRAARFLPRAWEGRSAREVRTDVYTVEETGRAAYAPVSRRVRSASPGRLVRVQAGLVPPSACLAQRGLGGVEQRRSLGARGRAD